MDITVYTDSQAGWVATLSALAAPIAAFMAVGVYIWQAQLLRRQLNQALYKQRFAVYVLLRQFLGEITRNVTAETNKSLEMLRETREAEFLFRPEIDEFIREVHTKAVVMATLLSVEKQVRAQGRELDQQRQSQLHATSQWLTDDSHGLAAKKFSPYLKVYSDGWNVTLRRLFRRRSH